MMAVVICTSHRLIFSNQAALAGTGTGTVVWGGCFLVFYFSWQVEHFLSEFFKIFPIFFLFFFCMTLKSQTVGLRNKKREHFQWPPSNNCSLWWFSWLVPFKPNWANLSFHIMFRFLKRKQFQLRISFSFFMLHQAIEASFCWNSCAENPRPTMFWIKAVEDFWGVSRNKENPLLFSQPLDDISFLLPYWAVLWLLMGLPLGAQVLNVRMDRSLVAWNISGFSYPGL